MEWLIEQKKHRWRKKKVFGNRSTCTKWIDVEKKICDGFKRKTKILADFVIIVLTSKIITDASEVETL